MSWSDDADRAFALRREELVREVIGAGTQFVDDLDAAAKACVAAHPRAALGSAVAVGAGLVIAAPRGRSPLLRVAFALLRRVPLAARLFS